MTARQGLTAQPYADQQNQLSSGISTLPRSMAVVGSAVTLSTQVMQLTYFTPVKSFTCAQVVMLNGTAAGATPTLVRAGLYSIAANGDGTLVASFANDTALFSVANSITTKSWTTPYAVAAGNRLALGALCVTGATLPILSGANFAGGLSAFSSRLALAPRMAASLAGQSDLPASFTAASLATAQSARIYAELIP